MVSAFFVGVAYSALTTISRSVFYTAQHTATYNQSILMVNLMESIGQIFIMLATANLIHNTVLTVLLTALFFILSFWMTRHNILYLSIK
ncbi:hypothetical protein DK880_00183 [Candidatus Cardinium hertigii]|uniref:Uncharacterized protein n=2 Tax=Candidatus Cardinium hertigii TaxID=247481 RepID=A0A2Z3L7B3_9BACT|nr:hypothetical protein DK880_00183 [Candidatus Cardinium hertigii]